MTREYEFTVLRETMSQADAVEFFRSWLDARALFGNLTTANTPDMWVVRCRVL